MAPPSPRTQLRDTFLFEIGLRRAIGEERAILLRVRCVLALAGVAVAIAISRWLRTPTPIHPTNQYQLVLARCSVAATIIVFVGLARSRRVALRVQPPLDTADAVNSVLRLFNVYFSPESSKLYRLPPTTARSPNVFERERERHSLRERERVRDRERDRARERERERLAGARTSLFTGHLRTSSSTLGRERSAYAELRVGESTRIAGPPSTDSTDGVSAAQAAAAKLMTQATRPGSAGWPDVYTTY